MPMIIIGRRPANSTGITGRLPMEKPRIVEGGLTEWDVLTETFWCRSLDNLIFTKGSARHTEADVTGIYYSQRCDVIGWKAGMPISTKSMKSSMANGTITQNHCRAPVGPLNLAGSAPALLRCLSIE